MPITWQIGESITFNRYPCKIFVGIPPGIPPGSQVGYRVGSRCGILEQDPAWNPRWDPRKKIENPTVLKFLNQAPGILESQVGSHKKNWKSHNFEVSQSSTQDPGRDNLVSRMLKSAILGGINWHPRWD